MLNQVKRVLTFLFLSSHYFQFLRRMDSFSFMANYDSWTIQSQQCLFQSFVLPNSDYLILLHNGEALSVFCFNVLTFLLVTWLRRWVFFCCNSYMPSSVQAVWVSVFCWIEKRKSLYRQTTPITLSTCKINDFVQSLAPCNDMSDRSSSVIPCSLNIDIKRIWTLLLVLLFSSLVRWHCEK